MLAASITDSGRETAYIRNFGDTRKALPRLRHERGGVQVAVPLKDMNFAGASIVVFRETGSLAQRINLRLEGVRAFGPFVFLFHWLYIHREWLATKI